MIAQAITDGPATKSMQLGLLDGPGELDQRHSVMSRNMSWADFDTPLGKELDTKRVFDALVTAGAVGGMFWGMLFGLIFLTPLFGMAVGAAVGALGGAFRDYGIDDDFIKRVRGAVTEGTSALFLMTSEAVLDRVADAMKGTKFEIMATNLSKEQEEKLREAFAQQ